MWNCRQSIIAISAFHCIIHHRSFITSFRLSLNPLCPDRLPSRFSIKFWIFVQMNLPILTPSAPHHYPQSLLLYTSPCILRAYPYAFDKCCIALTICIASLILALEWSLAMTSELNTSHQRALAYKIIWREHNDLGAALEGSSSSALIQFFIPSPRCPLGSLLPACVSKHHFLIFCKIVRIGGRDSFQQPNRQHILHNRDLQMESVAASVAFLAVLAWW